MSTIDSTLLLAGSLVVENVYIPYVNSDVGRDQGLKVARLVTLVIGALGLAVAIKPPAAILWIVTMSFSLMASAFTFPFLLGVWWPRATKQGAIVGMIAGAVSCVFWYVISYLKYQTLDNWIGGIWPAIFGSAVCLVLFVIVSLWTAPPPDDVREVFFGDRTGDAE